MKFIKITYITVVTPISVITNSFGMQWFEKDTIFGKFKMYRFKKL